MSWSSGCVKDLPSHWRDNVSFKLMKPGDRIGYIDTVPDKTSYKLVTAGKTPLKAFAVDMPMECTTVASIQAANKLTLSVKLDERTWTSLDTLDSEFDKFLVENGTKLFGAAEGDYLKKNPSAISLKRSKRLAPIGPSGEPLYDGRLKLRINGRSMEIESVVTADGARGAYVKSAVWSARTSPLPPKATRFSMVTGHTALDFQGNSMPIVRDTLSHVPSSFAGFGAGHVRFVGPGDMGRNVIIHHLLFKPAYWTNVGGGFMITLAAEHVIFENCDAGASGGAAGGGDEERFKPDGFMRDPHETGMPSPAPLSRPAPNVLQMLDKPPESAAKRRITITSAPGPFGAASEASRWAEEPPNRSMTGGAGGGAAGDEAVGSSSFRAISRSARIFCEGEEGEDEDDE
jgi:hypothetical protein